MNASKDEIKQTIQDVIAIESTDGFVFDYEKIDLLEQPHMDYPGYRISLKAIFGRMKDRVQIDVGIGDVVTPIIRELHLFQYKGRPMFEGEISLIVYPPETIFAEKLETVLSKGAANSRMKDYHDLLLLTRDEIQRFRENGSHSETEELLWNQCLIRSQEVEKYGEKLPEDTVDLIKTHVMRSRFLKFLDQGSSHGIFWL